MRLLPFLFIASSLSG